MMPGYLAESIARAGLWIKYGAWMGCASSVLIVTGEGSPATNPVVAGIVGQMREWLLTNGYRINNFSTSPSGTGHECWAFDCWRHPCEGNVNPGKATAELARLYEPILATEEARTERSIEQGRKRSAAARKAAETRRRNKLAQKLGPLPLTVHKRLGRDEPPPST